MDGEMSTQITVNGQQQTVNSSGDTPLLYVLRDELGLNGPKFGCGLSQCGACTVLVNGRAVRSCVYQLSRVGTQPVITLEGLGTPQAPHPLQAAFIDQQAGECAYCINGMIMVAASLLNQNASPTQDQIVQALNGNLCRCGSHPRIVAAVQQAAGHRHERITLLLAAGLPRRQRRADRELQPDAGGASSDELIAIQPAAGSGYGSAHRG
jgi:nicotinate dehydrogenase subunit A